ncbi:MAG: D-sedoheptulose 7-phosphate isomerase [Armatimonadetes bacterium]|nr:D-sedoheptulose 7-phosphate isomerase [Armatimonadota bacterium]
MLEMTPQIEEALDLLLTSLKQGGKIVLFGNGGSAADAQHIAAELVGRFTKERPSLPAIALNTNTSIITSIGNDYSFKEIFARQLESILSSKDIVIAISTSGNSANVLKGIKRAKNIGAKIIGFSGKNGGKLSKLVDICLKVPSEITARIQEGHILLGHILCELIEEKIYNLRISLKRKINF